MITKRSAIYYYKIRFCEDQIHATSLDYGEETFYMDYWTTGEAERRHIADQVFIIT